MEVRCVITLDKVLQHDMRDRAVRRRRRSHDRIFVRKGDGTILTFEVYENRLVAPDEFETIETLTVPNPGSIVLVTCENESLDGGYTDRRAIFARPVDG